MNQVPGRSLRFRASGLLKALVFGFYKLPFSRFGLEPGLVPFLPPQSPITMVDVGAASGEFAATVQAHCGLRSALLVEPQPAFYRQLEERFPGPTMTVHNCAVSDASGTMPMEILNANYSSSLLPVIPEAGGANRRLDLSVRETIVVDVRRLDDLARQVTGDIDLLKIDTQGSELHVLRGAVETLRRVRLIWIEVSFVPLYEGSALFADVHALLRQHRFYLHSLHDGFRGDHGELLQADALFIAEPQSSRLQ